jgi:hypothetical protein
MRPAYAEGHDGRTRDPRRALTMEDVVRIATYKDRSPSHEAKVVAVSYHQLATDLAGELGKDDNTFYCYATWGSKAVSEQLDLTQRSPFWTDVCDRLRVPARYRRPFRLLALALLGPSYQLGLALANRAILLETGSVGADLWRGGDYRLQVRASSRGERTVGDGAARRPYHEVLADDDAPAEVRRPAFLSSLLGPAKEEYLDMVVRLLTEAKGTDDPELRAELILGANVALVAYEQSRCQRLLDLVFYRPVRWSLRVSWRSLWSLLTRRPRRRFWIYSAPHDSQPRFVRWAERGWAKFYTKYLMSMRTPLGTIRLGKPLPVPDGIDAGRLWAPIRHPEVRRLVERFVSDGERANEGVVDWLDYRERMRYIVAYFRMYQAVPALFDHPFDAPLVDLLEADMWRGEVPDPVAEWYEKRVETYERKAARGGMRGAIFRQVYRSPLVCDPDAAELVDLDLRDFISARPC